MAPTELLIPVSGGELLDKITILQIKLARSAGEQRRNVASELALLVAVAAERLPASGPLSALERELKEVNLELWTVEETVRQHEASQDFGPGFVEQARRIYRLNDQRHALRRRISEILGSSVIEEKVFG
jgi:hypothetical protein